MRMFAAFWLYIATALLTGCASSGKVPLKVHHINSLSSFEKNMGEFLGLEFLADPIEGRLKNRVNIFYLHGIGWTENPDSDQLADDFLAGIAGAYGQDVKGQIIRTSCGQADSKAPHIKITGNAPKRFETALPGSALELDELVCMDKQTLDVDDALEYVVYRIFWDDIFWNRLQFPHVGQDDDQGSSKEIARLRRKYNRKLKDELMNYGISDAVMYLGPAGTDIRSAIRGAMCSASLDAAGYDFAKQGQRVSYDNICQLASNTAARHNQFAFVSESLGSKITYDVLREAMNDGRDTALDDMVAGSETYMLANQIALLSLSDLTVQPKQRPRNLPPGKRPKIIAMSELNDFLTYELVPFYEQLWKRSSNSEDRPNSNTAAARQAMVEALGFDMIDMRLEFADRIVPLLKGFVDPLQAHSGHASEPELMLYMLCGARKGRLNRKECLATADLEKLSK